MAGLGDVARRDDQGGGVVRRGMAAAQRNMVVWTSVVCAVERCSVPAAWGGCGRQSGAATVRAGRWQTSPSAPFSIFSFVSSSFFLSYSSSFFLLENGAVAMVGTRRSMTEDGDG